MTHPRLALLASVFALCLAAGGAARAAEAQHHHKHEAHGAGPSLTPEVAKRLAALPMACIHKEFPNKTQHVDGGVEDARLTPRELHPAFYGCFDWHSSVHGHWMLVKLLHMRALDDATAAEVTRLLNETFKPEHIQAEADYFGKYPVSKNFERTYGWAWLLQLDLELASWSDPRARQWRAALAPLTQKVVTLWKEYLPKETYPERVGTHTNSAFGQGFALDWARGLHDEAFVKALEAKAKELHGNDKAIPAHLEPGGADFFSPSLLTADLMTRVLPAKDFVRWWDAYMTPAGLARLSEAPKVSDITDYHIGHLVGLSFNRAWCMRRIAGALPLKHPHRKRLFDTANQLLAQALPLIFKGDNYGGDHWLASFAVYAMSVDEE